MKGAEDEMIKWALGLGYSEPRVIKGVICCTIDMLTTRALIVGMDHIGPKRRYCYGDRREASAALHAYTDPEEHPTGNWIKLKGFYRGQWVDDINPEWSRSP